MTTKTSTFSLRLKLFAKVFGLKQEEMALKLGISRNNYAKMSDNPTLEKIVAILNAFPEINPAWLLTGEEPMIKVKQSLDNVAISKGVNTGIDNSGTGNVISIEGSKIGGGASDANILYEKYMEAQNRIDALSKLNEELMKKFLNI